MNRRVLLSLSFVAAVAAFAYGKDQIPNPEYENWKDCKAGSWVTVKTESVMNGRTTGFENTYKLLAIDADKATLETTMTMVINGKPMTMPASKRDIAAKLDKPDDSKASEDKTKMDKTEGDEDIEIDGKKVTCHWHDTKMTGEDGNKSEVKTWKSDEIPGKTAKMWMTSEKPQKSETTFTTLKFEKK